MILGGVGLLLVNVLILLAIMVKERRKKRKNRSAVEQQHNCQSMSDNDPSVLHLDHDCVLAADHQIRIQDLEPMMMEIMRCHDQQMTYDASHMEAIETILMSDQFYSPADQQIILPDPSLHHHQQQLLQEQQSHSLSSYSTINDEVSTTGMTSQRHHPQQQQQQRQIKGIMKSRSSSGSSAAKMQRSVITSASGGNNDQQEHDLGSGAEFKTPQMCLQTAAISPNGELVNGVSGSAAETSSPFFDSSSSIGSCTLITSTNTSSPSFRNYPSSNLPTSASCTAGQQIVGQQVNGSSNSLSRPHAPQRNSGGLNGTPVRQVTWHVISENCEICDQPTY